ncbi:MAG: hypothetical protein A2033_01385 [Bacteroidetes bacterium GWA2_31_9]|nr:MAG: hypothetical protein A2033_01385 [Bacteroidetes bacterium GWA2_31_9]
MLFGTSAFSQSMIVDSNTIIKVSFTGQHTYVSDLGFYLLAPGYGPGQLNESIPGNYGTVELLPSISGWNDSITSLPDTVLGCSPSDFGYVCNGGNNFNNFSFTSTLPASNPFFTACICDLQPPLTGNFASAGPWSQIYGFDAYSQGWGLQIYDCEPIDNGYLTTATVYFINGADTVKYIIPIGSYPINDGACDYTAASYFQLIKSSDSCDISVNYTSIDPSGSNTTDGSIDITVTGGTPPYQYIWNNGTTTEDLNQIPFGTYFVNVFDNNQCSQSLTLSLIDSSTSTSSSCQAYFAYYPDSISMGDPGPYAFYDYSQNMDSSQINVISWYWSVSGGGTSTTSSVQNPVFYLTTPGYYSVCLYIITADSCSSSYCDSVVINGTNPCDINIAYNYVMPSSPNAMDGSIDITVTGGTPPYQYVWNNGISTEDLNQISSGVYTVNVSDNNQCSQSVTVSLMDSSSTLLNAYTDVYNETSFGACDGMIAVYPSGGTSPYQFVWSNGATTQYIDSLCMGTYYVSVYDALQNSYVTSGYVYYDSTNVNCYAYFIPSAQTIQPGDIVSYTDYSDSTVISWTWSFNGGTPNSSTLQNPPIVYNTIGTYDACLTITTSNGCSSTYCDNITVSTDTIVIDTCNIYISGVITNCSNANTADGAIDITVTGGFAPYSYNWTSGNGVTYSTEDLNNILSGSYTVEVSDSTGCVSYQQFYVSYGNDTTAYCNLYAYSDVTPVSYIGANDGSIDVTVVGGTAPYYFNWSNGATTEDLIGVASGAYVVSIYSSDSLCPAYTLTANVYEPYDPSGGIVIDSLYTNNIDTCFISTVDSFYVSGVFVNNNNTITVTWEFVVGGVTYVINATYTCSASGNYVVYLTINCGSNKGLTTYMTYIHTEITTASPVPTSESGISLYPNPVKEKLNISFKNMDVNGATLNIYNISGQVVYSNNEINGKTEVNTSNLSEGVYIVKIISDNNQYVSKFIK